jgi:membrane peptidoglycan carboxypeptidase
VHNAALVAIDSATGEIVAYVGSVDYYNREDPRVQGQFDVAGLGLRQSGSAYKPFTYSQAFASRQATLSTFLMDTLTEFGQHGQSYRPRNADRTEHGPLLAVDALNYSLNIPSVQMQYIAGVEETAHLSEQMGIASADYILGLHPNLTLTLGTVPTRLVNMTQAYGAFAQEGVVQPARTIKEIRDRYGRLVYSLDNDGPQPRRVLEPEVAYLTHWILDGVTNPQRNVFWGRRSQINDPEGTRREAGFKTGTTDHFRDVSGYGYVPGGLVTGVWMGNNNMEDLVSEFGEGLFAAEGPLYLWQDFMTRALNEPWEWNGQQPVPRTSFERPAGVVTATVCRWTGMAATGNCGATIDLPFIDGTQPPPDNVYNGCVNVTRKLELDDRPDNWVEAAQTFVERVRGGQLGPAGDHQNWRDDPDIRYQINPLYGESSLPPVCAS